MGSWTRFVKQGRQAKKLYAVTRWKSDTPDRVAGFVLLTTGELGHFKIWHRAPDFNYSTIPHGDALRTDIVKLYKTKKAAEAKAAELGTLHGDDFTTDEIFAD